MCATPDATPGVTMGHNRLYPLAKELTLLPQLMSCDYVWLLSDTYHVK